MCPGEHAVTGHHEAALVDFSLLAGRAPSTVLLSEGPCLPLGPGKTTPHRWSSTREERYIMALLEDFTLGSVTSSALVGLGLVVAAPVLLPVVGAVVR